MVPTDGSTGYGGGSLSGPRTSIPSGCGRNSRLWNQHAKSASGSIRSLARFIGLHSPEYLHWCGQLQTIALKKVARKLIAYLEKDELDALLKAPDCRTAQGRRDYVVLLFLYNTGARADEVAHVQIGDLDLGVASSRDASSVVLRGKGNKLRRCPLWPKTVDELRRLVGQRAASQHVFLNRRGQPLTRFGIHTLVERHAAKVAAKLPSVAKKRVSPHTIRHTTQPTCFAQVWTSILFGLGWAMSASARPTCMLKSTWEMKAKALVKCEIKDGKPKKPWRRDSGLMEFLRTL